MSELYNVYAHPQRGLWGFTSQTAPGNVKTAAIDKDGRVTLGEVQPIKLAPLLQQRLRAGFKAVAQPKYLSVFDEDGAPHGEFVVQHPDLGSTLEGELLFFVAVPQGADMRQVAADWRDRLEDLDGNDPARDRWLELCARATAYVSVKTLDVHAALVTAQWARENDLVLVSNAAGLPDKGPKEQRHEWRCFLADKFEQAAVDRALADLGWPLHEALELIQADHTTTSVEQEGWLTLARQASF
jgi:hypothetical protein